ncbi:hypothetical protein E2320_016695, partial [Naja naja]
TVATPLLVRKRKITSYDGQVYPNGNHLGMSGTGLWLPLVGSSFSVALFLCGEDAHPQPYEVTVIAFDHDNTLQSTIT